MTWFHSNKWHSYCHGKDGVLTSDNWSRPTPWQSLHHMYQSGQGTHCDNLLHAYVTPVTDHQHSLNSTPWQRCNLQWRYLPTQRRCSFRCRSVRIGPTYSRWARSPAERRRKHTVCADNPSSTWNSCVVLAVGNVRSWIWRRTIWRTSRDVTHWPGRGRSLVVPVCWYLLWSLAIVEWWHPNRCAMALFEMPTWSMLKTVHVPQLSTLPSLVQRSLKHYFIMKVAFQRPPFIAPINMIQFTFFILCMQ